jgi:uncharacterized protein YdhG (YjbR/CyaY superfamily)
MKLGTREISCRIAHVQSPPATIDEYLSRLAPEPRAAFEKLRRAIQAAAPKAEEAISYHLPAFRLGGKLLVTFAAAKNHCSFYPGAHPIRVCAEELEPYVTAKGTIRFSPEQPLPAALVRKLVKARVAEFAE